MFDGRGGVLLTPPGWDDEPPPDLGNWEPIPLDVLAELDNVAPDMSLGGPAFHDLPVDEAIRLPLGAHTLALLTMSPIGDLSDAARVWALKRSGELISHIEAFRNQLIAAIAGPKPADRAEDFAAHEVAIASNSSVYAADRRVAFARALAGRLSATREAMAEGRITERQASALCEGVSHLPDKLAQQIEERMLRFAYRQDLTLFKASLRKWLARLDPSWTERAHTARQEVHVEHTVNDDGTGDLWVRGPLEKTAVLDAALSAYAAASKVTQEGTVAERKLAGLVEWAEAYLTSREAPRRHGRAVHVNLCVDPAGLFGLADHPAEVIGYGMVPADAAAHLLAEGSPVRRLIIDEHDGHLLDYGTKTYVVPPALADQLIALHVTGAAPNSRLDASLCDMDHNLPHDEGGPTSGENVAPQERRWHRAKTHAGWTYIRNRDGTVDWTSPAGLTQRVTPHDYRLGP